MASKSTPATEEKADRPASLKRMPRPAIDEDRDPVDVGAAAPPQAAKPVKTPQPRKPRGPYNVIHVERVQVSYRLPPDAVELIEAAKLEAAARGDRLTKDDAVAQAIRGFYGKKRRR